MLGGGGQQTGWVLDEEGKGLLAAGEGETLAKARLQRGPTSGIHIQPLWLPTTHSYHRRRLSWLV